jgi:hypothetical protein
MQTKIHNPYQAQLDAGKVPQYLLISFSNLSIGFDEGVEAATKALVPKRFSDGLPEEGQRIIMLSKDTSLNAGKFDSVYLVDRKHYSHAKYTHWLPYPELT